MIIFLISSIKLKKLQVKFLIQNKFNLFREFQVTRRIGIIIKNCNSHTQPYFGIELPKLFQNYSFFYERYLRTLHHIQGIQLLHFMIFQVKKTVLFFKSALFFPRDLMVVDSGNNCGFFEDIQIQMVLQLKRNNS